MKQLGINLEWSKDWSNTIIFNDYMKQASRFATFATPWLPAPDLLLDSNHMPLEDFGVIIFRRTALKKDLNMTLYYKCLNSTPIITSQHGNIVITSSSKDVVTGITKVNFYVKSGSSQLFLKFANTNGGISYISLYEENTENNGTFDLDFLNLIKDYKCLRYMELSRTNDSTISRWNDRTLPDDICQDYKGMAWEYVAELSNITKTDMWINIPHLADDDYVKNLAVLLKNNLNYNQNIYIEYSNELWNGMFKQTGYINQLVSDLNKAGDKKYSYDGEMYIWAQRKNADRCRDISNIFAEVWGKDQINKRVRVVIGGWGAVYGHSRTHMAFLTRQYPDEPVSSYIYGIATGSYYGEGTQLLKNSTSEEDMVKAIDDDVLNFEKRHNYKAFKELADNYNIKHLIYEGGIDIVHAGYIKGDAVASSREQKRLSFHNNLSLKKSVKDILNNFAGEVFMWYKASINDDWGFTSEIGRIDAPIQSALREFLEGGIAITSLSLKKNAPKKSGIMGKGFNRISKLKNIKRGKR